MCPKTEGYPLSVAQNVIYLDQLRHQQSPLYNIGGYIRLTDVDLPRLRSAHSQVVQNNDMFGIRLDETGGRVTQSIVDKRTTTLELIDLSGARNPEQAAQQWLKDKFHQPLTIHQSELFYACLLRLSDNEFWYVGLAHHLVIDGWGYANWALQLADIYSGKTPRPSESFAALQQQEQQYLQSDKYHSDVAYWTEQLHHSPGAFIRSRYPLEPGRPTSARHVAHIDNTLFTTLNRLARELKVGLPQLLLGCFGATFAKSHSQQQLAFGIPLHNRQGPRQKQTVGLFTNIALLPVDFSVTEPFAGLVANINKSQRGLLRHKKLPVSQVAADLGLDSGLYSIIFNYLNLDYSGLTFDERLAGIAYQSHDHEQVPLTINVWDGNDGVELHFDYCLAYFTGDEIALLSDRLMWLLNHLESLQDQPLSEWPLLSASESAQINQFQAPTVREHDRSLCVHQLFEAQAKARPGATALQWQSQSLDYQTLNARANRLAWYLIEHQDIGPDTLVGVHFNRSIEMIVAVLAVLKAGGAYLPLDPDYPKERLDFMVCDARPQAILCTADSRPQSVFTSEPAPSIVVLDELALQSCHEHNPDRQSIGLKPEHLAYVIYTSGSTGQPKGVMVEHRNVVNYQLNMALRYNIDATDRVLQFSTICFDIFVEEVFGALCQGAALVLRSEHCIADINAFNAFCVDHALTVVSLPTAYFAKINQGDRKLDCASLRSVIVGGEKLNQTTVDEYLTEVPQVRLFNTYGPTEATVTATGQQVQAGKLVTIGTPNANNVVLVLNNDLDPLGLYTVGELYIGGEGVARGYLNQPQLTAERFIDNPHRTVKGLEHCERLYKTGDLVRWLPGGELEFVGRVDEQVKVHGYRVEPGEIERHLRELTGVDSALVAVDTAMAEPVLSAWVKPRQYSESAQQQQQLIGQLRQALEQRLPNYMIPAGFALVADWPLNVNGKIDKPRLPQIDQQLNQAVYQGPGNPLERKLVAIWAEALAIDPAKLSIQAHFFALGGHSLLAVKVIADIAQQLDVQLALRDIFECPTIAGLALRIKTGLRQTLPAITAIAPGQHSFDLSYAQQRLWFIDKLQGGTPQYNMFALLQLAQPLNPDVVGQAFAALVLRHQVLRSYFVESGDEVKQQISSDVPFNIARHDLRGQSADAQLDALEQLVEAESAHVFNLAGELLLRVAHVAMAHDDYPHGALLFNMHHVASDGWSIEILQREFATLYQAFAAGQPDPLPALDIQYVDYAHWQRDWLKGPVLEQQLQYWQQQLADAPLQHNLPLKGPRPTVKNSQGERLQSHLDGATVAALGQVAKAFELTPFMLLHGLLALVLSRHSNSRDIMLGTPVANRLHGQVQDLIGFFANTLVLRANTDWHTLGDYLNHIKAVHQGAQDHQDVPFEQLVERMDVPRSRAISPLVQIILTFVQNSAQSGHSDEHALFRQVDNGIYRTKFDLEIELSLNDQDLQILWTYDNQLFSRTAMVECMAHFEQLLEDVAARFGQGKLAKATGLDELQLMDESGLAQLIASQGSEPADYDRNSSFHQRFEQQVAETPDAIALVDGDTRISYQALNAEANRLAHCLMSEQGVKPGALVGICLERGPDLWVAVLAVFKAGAAYVPLDVNYPPQRLAYMVEDAKPQLVISRQAIVERLALKLPALSLETVKLQDWSAANPPQQGQGDALAYVIYTSGLHRSTQRGDGVPSRPGQSGGQSGPALCPSAAKAGCCNLLRSVLMPHPGKWPWHWGTVPACICATTIPAWMPRPCRLCWWLRALPM